jgi:hypothetical protein
LRQALGPSNAGNTRNNANTTMMSDPGSMHHAPDAKFARDFARRVPVVQLQNCISATFIPARLWNDSPALDSNFPHVAAAGEGPRR